MALNALKDLAWIPTRVGKMSVRDVLCSDPAGRDGLSTLCTPDLFVGPGFRVGAVLRLLRDIAVLAERRRSQEFADEDRRIPEPELIDEAIEELAFAVDPFDEKQPFLQRPVEHKEKDGEPKDPVKKLSPVSPADNAERFWNFGMLQQDTLDLPEALLALLIWHCYSPAGNGKYMGEKCAMGAPGFHFPGTDFSATEVLWRTDSIYETLLMNIPKDWLKAEDLPAWAWRDPEKIDEFTRNEEPHPLWDASWSSNTAACLWEEGRLLKVKTGGIPSSWYSLTQGRGQEDRKTSSKDWWDLRNTRDPFYLYVADKEGRLKAQRVDIGLDATAAAVAWNARGNPRKLKEKAETSLVRPGSRATIVFIRHRVEGSASSPVIRASTVLDARDKTSLWAPSESLLDTIETLSEQINEFHRLAFRYLPESLSVFRRDVSTSFWRLITPAFEEFMLDDSAWSDVKEQKLMDAGGDAAIGAFDEVTMPHRSAKLAEISAARTRLQIAVAKLKKSKKEEEEQI